MLNGKRWKIALGMLGCVALFTGIYLVSRYNITGEFASKVATTSQNVKLCHNDCRYVTEQVVLLLRLGQGLIACGALSIAFLVSPLQKSKA